MHNRPKVSRPRHSCSWPASRSLGVCLERGQFGRPERFDLFNPLAQGCERLWPQAVNANTGIMLDLAVLDEPALPQHTKVAAQKRRADGKRRGDVAGALGLFPQQLDDAAPCWISEGDERMVDLSSRHRGYGFRRRWVNHQWCPSGSTAP